MNDPRALPQIEPQPYSFGAAFSQGWSLFGARYGMILAATAIYLGVAILTQVTQVIIQVRSGQVVAYLLGVPIAILFTTPFQASWTWAAVAASRGEPATASTLVRAFERYGQTVGLAVLIFLASVLAGIPLVLLALFLGFLGPLGIALLVILGIPIAVVYAWVCVRLMLAYCLILDDRLGAMSPIEAVRTAFEMTSGIRGWSLLGLNFVLGLLVVLSILLLILPFVFVGLPFMAAAQAMAYQQLAADHGLISARSCRYCGFDLTGLSDEVCPECGAAAREDAPGASGRRG